LRFLILPELLADQNRNISAESKSNGTTEDEKLEMGGFLVGK
jgi:hypothetical protein